MKSIITIAVIATLSVSAIADVTNRSENGKYTATVHTETVTGKLRTSDNELLAAGFISLRSGDRMERNLYATECGDAGGRIATFDNRGNVILEQVWIMKGDSMVDVFAANLCREAVIKLAVAELKKH